MQLLFAVPGVALVSFQMVLAQDQPGKLQIDDDAIKIATITTFEVNHRDQYLSVDKKTMKPILTEDETHWLIVNRPKGKKSLIHIGFVDFDKLSESEPSPAALLRPEDDTAVALVGMDSEDAKVKFRDGVMDPNNHWKIERPSRRGPNDKRTRPSKILSDDGALSVRPDTGEVVGEDLKEGNQHFWRVSYGDTKVSQVVGGPDAGEEIAKAIVKTILGIVEAELDAKKKK